MAHYKDSLGNVYNKLPSRPPVHKAKSTHVKTEKKRHNKHRDASNVTKPSSKYARYRRVKGKPNGPGSIGNKSGKNKIR